MKFILILALSTYCLTAALTDEEINREWFNFNQKYGKQYRSRDKNGKRFENFKENLEKISEHNKRFEQKLVSYKMAVNPFTDMDLKELERSYMGLKISEKEKRSFRHIPKARVPIKKYISLPTSLDWRDKGAVSPVKNQMACGSCWAFASTGALEAQHFVKHNKSVVLSEQNLVDCVNENFGCEGGWMIPCFDYVKANGGINPESTYPYEAVDGKCRYQSKHVAAICYGYSTIRQDDEQHLLEVVATKGPVAVAIDVNSNFMNYVEGIYDDLQCTQLVNHAVLVVGYGTANGQDYWLVKNSWGVEWGEQGYIKMARNKNNQCAIASYAVYPMV